MADFTHKSQQNSTLRDWAIAIATAFLLLIVVGMLPHAH